MKTFVRKIYSRYLALRFRNSQEYWDRRYRLGGTSGAGSYSELANYKASILNRFVEAERIERVIEFGCGDGNQLRYARYPDYLGLDVSQAALERCRTLFAEDASKQFKLMRDYDGERADLALSLDVIYHLVEDDVFNRYMHLLFRSAARFAIIYSSNTADNSDIWLPHVRNRCFTDWVGSHARSWRLKETIENPYRTQLKNSTASSISDFFVFERASQCD